MIAFGCSITTPEVYERYAGPGIRVAAEPDSPVFAYAAVGSVARTYNLILDQVVARDDLEALVLVHQDAEITDRQLCEKLRRVLRDPDVAVVGCVGAVGASSIAWWEGSVTWEAFARSCAEYDGAELPDLSWNGQTLPPYAPMGEVDTLYGFLLAVSPWAVRNLRFDESLDLLHGYDFDLCLQARAAGRKVVAESLGVTHHHPIELITDGEAWIEAHMRVSEKWTGRMPHLDEPESDPKRWARRAETEAGAARLAGASKLLQAYASAEVHEARLKEVTKTTSWRITEPLRQLNAFRKATLGRRRYSPRARRTSSLENAGSPR
jgi:hypothetical protein